MSSGVSASMNSEDLAAADLDSESAVLLALQTRRALALTALPLVSDAHNKADNKEALKLFGSG